MVLTQDKVLVQLDSHPDHTITESNIYIPQFINAESDGGRPMSIASNQKYLASGVVMGLSAAAQKKMEDQNTPIKKGDKVFVSTSVVNQGYHFQLKRDSIVYDFDGLVLIPTILIEAILNEE